MHTRSLRVFGVLAAGVWIVFAATAPARVTAAGDRTSADDGDRDFAKIALLDDCDPRISAGWNTPTDPSQCIRREGAVSRSEFTMFLTSPFSAAVVGHPAWTIDPTYTKPEAGERLRVRNEGGRGHTFTEVANYGGGFIPVLNIGVTPAPECLAAAGSIIPPGGKMDVTGLAPGNHKFQCCIHPWMRALVKVQPDEN